MNQGDETKTRATANYDMRSKTKTMSKPIDDQSNISSTSSSDDSEDGVVGQSVTLLSQPIDQGRGKTRNHQNMTDFHNYYRNAAKTQY